MWVVVADPGVAESVVLHCWVTALLAENRKNCKTDSLSMGKCEVVKEVRS